MEAPEGRSLPALLAPQLRQTLLRLSKIDAAKDLARRALQALSGFAKGLKVAYQDIEVGFDLDPEPGLADNGDLEQDLQALLLVAAQDQLPAILRDTHGYPYFLQECGKHAWDAATSSPIRSEDVERSSALTVAALDESFFRVRLDRLTPSEKRYLRAMAELGPGAHRSGDIAKVLGKAVSALAPVRNQLITKGMVWSPSHGDTEFTVPLFDEFMKRILPDESWRTE